MNTPAHYALVTGASSGIGAAIAREYAHRGVPLILTARRRDRLERLADELRSKVPVEIIVADLADPRAPESLCDEIRHRGLSVRILVNNAGYGIHGHYIRSDWQRHADFVQVMVTAVSELAWRLLPMLQAAGNGRIINVASFAALVPGGEGQTLYAAAKAYMVRFSESLALETAKDGLHVVALCPGFTYSEFHDVTGMREIMYAKLPRWGWLHAEDVARAAVEGAERGKVIVIPGTVYKLIHFLLRFMPRALVDWIMAKGSRDLRLPDGPS